MRPWSPSIPGTLSPSLAQREEDLAQWKARDMEGLTARYMVWGFFLFALVQVSFVMYSISVSRPLEAGLDLFCIGVYLFGLFWLRRGHHKAASRLTLGSLFLSLFHSAFFMDHPTGNLLFYFALPHLFFFVAGIREGLLWTAGLIVFGLFTLFIPSATPMPPVAPLFTVRFLVAFAMATAFSWYGEKYRQRSWEQVASIANSLMVTMEELKVLGGLVPVCSYCKKLRDDKGYWRDLRYFLETNSSATISSVLCEECKTKLGASTAASFVPTSELLPWDNVRDEVLRSKATFFKRIFILGFVVVILFSVHDFLFGRVREALFQGVLSVGFVAGYMHLKRHKGGRFFYSVIALLSLLMIFHPFLSATTDGGALLWFFLFPFWVYTLLGSALGSLFVLLSLGALGLIIARPPFMASFPFSTEQVVLFSGAYVLVILLSYKTERLREENMVIIEDQLVALRQSYKDVKALKGIIPVCSECQKLLSDDGAWTPMEQYLPDHTAAELTHGICRSCMAREFPDIYKEMEEEGAFAGEPLEP